MVERMEPCFLLKKALLQKHTARRQGLQAVFCLCYFSGTSNTARVKVASTPFIFKGKAARM